MQILNTYQEASELIKLCAIFGGIALMISIFIIVYMLTEKDYKKSLIVWSLILFSLSVGLLYKHFTLEKDTYHEVIIEDSDNFDFEAYEIVESRGKIIVVKER